MSSLRQLADGLGTTVGDLLGGPTAQRSTRSRIDLRDLGMTIDVFLSDHPASLDARITELQPDAASTEPLVSSVERFGIRSRGHARGDRIRTRDPPRWRRRVSRGRSGARASPRETGCTLPLCAGTRRGSAMNLIDAHAHLGDFPGFVSGGERTAETLIESWDASGVDCGLISVLDPFDVQNANDRVRIACEAHPGRIYGYIYLRLPDVEGSLAELERCRDAACFRAVKLHPANDAYFPFYEGYRPVLDRIEELGLPVLWHLGTYPYSHPLQIAVVARRHPGLTHILGHFGIAESPGYRASPPTSLRTSWPTPASIRSSGS